MLFTLLIILAFLSTVAAGRHVAQEGAFAYKDVENYTFNDFKFTILLIIS